MTTELQQDLMRFRYGQDGVPTAVIERLIAAGLIESAGRPGYWCETLAGMTALGLQ